MSVLLKLVLISTLTILAFTQCANNPLLKSSSNPNGVEGLSSPQTVSGLKACNSLEGKSSCCSVDTINNFKSALQSELEGLQNSVGELDKKKAKAMGAMGKFMQKSVDMMKKLKDFNLGGKRLLQSDDTLSQEEVTKTKQLMNDGWKAMQKNRSNCFSFAFQLGSKLKCMACMTDTSAFITNGDLKISSKTCTNFLAKCNDYLASLEGMAKFDNADLIEKAIQEQENVINKLVQFMDEAKSLTDKAKGGDAGAAMQLLSKSLELAALAGNSTKSMQVKVPKSNVPKLPPGCSNSNGCNLICERIITSKGLNVSALSKGGMDEISVENLPLFGNRLLGVSNDGFDIETQVSSGFESSITFAENPGNASPEGGSFSERIPILISFCFFIVSYIFF